MNAAYSMDEKLRMATKWATSNGQNEAIGKHLRKNQADNALPVGIVRYIPKGRSKSAFVVTAKRGNSMSFASREEALAVHEAMHALVDLNTKD